MPFHHYRLLKKVGHKFGRTIKKDIRKRPKSIDKFIRKHPSVTIDKIQICRAPIKKVIQTVLNKISSGKLEEVKETYNYDEIFHLFAIIYFSNGKKYLIEKNEVINFRKASGKDTAHKGTECREVRVKSNKTFGEIVQDMEKTTTKLYLYSAQKYNCQDYITRLVQAMDVRGKEGFINQYNAREILEADSVRKLSQAITTIANAFQRYVLGK